jgi:hypothetical protein
MEVISQSMSSSVFSCHSNNPSPSRYGHIRNQMKLEASPTVRRLAELRTKEGKLTYRGMACEYSNIQLTLHV